MWLLLLTLVGVGVAWGGTNPLLARMWGAGDRSECVPGVAGVGDARDPRLQVSRQGSTNMAAKDWYLNADGYYVYVDPNRDESPERD